MNRTPVVGVCGILLAALALTYIFPVQGKVSNIIQAGTTTLMVSPQSRGYEPALDLHSAAEYARARGYPEPVIGRLSSVVRVFIYVYNMDEHAFIPHRMGSGFLVKEGLIMSAAHVSEAPQEPKLIPPLERGFECLQVRATVQFGEAPKILAQIVWYDPEADLLMVRFHSDSLPKSIVPIPIAEHDPAVGGELYLDGFLFGGPAELIMKDVPTVLPPLYFRIAGEEVYGRGRFLLVKSPEYGYSGGPVFDSEGNVQGVAIEASAGKAFGGAVSREEVLKALSQVDRVKPYCPE